MPSSSIRRLIGFANCNAKLVLPMVLGALIAACVPVLIVVLGIVIHVLVMRRVDDIGFGTFIPNFSRLFAVDEAPLTVVFYCLLFGVGCLMLAASGLFLYYRTLIHFAVCFETRLITRLRQHAQVLSVVRTLSAQETALTDSLEYHLPRVRSVLMRWYRFVPRHLIQLVACTLVAMLVHPLIVILTVVAAGILLVLYRYSDKFRRTFLPVVRERASQERAILTNLCIKGPLLETIHSTDALQQRFEEQISGYERDATRSLSSSNWKLPMVLALGSLIGFLFFFVVSVQILQDDPQMSVAGACMLVVCGSACGYSVFRLHRSWNEMRNIEPAVEELMQFFSQQVETLPFGEVTPIADIGQGAELEHVTLQDSRGRKLLDDVSVELAPGQLIGLVAESRLDATALAELLLGYGRPVSGRLLLDGKLLTGMSQRGLTANSTWVAADGAVVTGTLRQNLQTNQNAVDDDTLRNAFQVTGLEKTVQSLESEQDTLITANDDRLSSESSFRIGLARAWLRRPVIVVVDEPDTRFDPQTEQETLDAIRALVRPGCITVVIPNRLVTLRGCDRIVMLHEHRIRDFGSHMELLQRNDLYRHLNYLRFNPFRAIQG